MTEIIQSHTMIFQNIIDETNNNKPIDLVIIIELIEYFDYYTNDDDVQIPIKTYYVDIQIFDSNSNYYRDSIYSNSCIEKATNEYEFFKYLGNKLDLNIKICIIGNENIGNKKCVYIEDKHVSFIVYKFDKLDGINYLNDLNKNINITKQKLNELEIKKSHIENIFKPEL